MRLRLVLPLAALLVAGCRGNPVGGTTGFASCTYAARVGDTDYALYAESAADRVGPEFTRTTRQRGCDDVIIVGSVPESWKNGDSSFPANTPLYASLDYPTSDVLLVRWTDGRYLLLRRLPHPPAGG